MNYGDTTVGTINSDRTLMAIVHALHENEEMGVTDLASTVGASKSAIHKHLKTLEQLNYVVNSGGTYRLGFKFFTYGVSVKMRSELCEMLGEKARKLADLTDEVGVASIEEHGKGTFIAIENYDLTRASTLGTRFHLNVSAAGKAMLSKFSNERIEETIDRYGLPKRSEYTITSRAELFKEIDRIRERNYATNIEEMREGLNALSTAVHDPETGEIGALSISGPANRVVEDEYADILLEVMNELELQMNYG